MPYRRSKLTLLLKDVFDHACSESTLIFQFIDLVLVACDIDLLTDASLSFAAVNSTAVRYSGDRGSQPSRKRCLPFHKYPRLRCPTPRCSRRACAHRARPARSCIMEQRSDGGVGWHSSGICWIGPVCNSRQLNRRAAVCAAGAGAVSAWYVHVPVALLLPVK